MQLGLTFGFSGKNVHLFLYGNAQNIPGHIAHMYKLQQTLKHGKFAITKSSVPFISIGPDQTQEQAEYTREMAQFLANNRSTSFAQVLLEFAIANLVCRRH